jgi:hypothetical protein
MVHPLVELLQREHDDQPPVRPVTQADVDKAIPDDLRDGYEGR